MDNDTDRPSTSELLAADESNGAVGVVRLLPEVFEDEDGERWWAFGHIDPFAFVLGVVAELLDDFRSTDEVPLIHSMLEAVKHDWFRPDPTDDERNLPCKATDEGAEAFTWLDLSGRDDR